MNCLTLLDNSLRKQAAAGNGSDKACQENGPDVRLLLEDDNGEEFNQ